MSKSKHSYRSRSPNIATKKVRNVSPEKQKYHSRRNMADDEDGHLIYHKGDIIQGRCTP